VSYLLHAGAHVIARNGRRAGSVGWIACLLYENALRGERYVVSFPDGERISYIAEDLDLAPAPRAKPLSESGAPR
jgi:hypothetical protein